MKKMGKGSKRRPCNNEEFDIRWDCINWAKRKKCPKPTNVMKDKKKYNRKNKDWKNKEEE